MPNSGTTYCTGTTKRDTTLELHLNSVFQFGVGRYFPGILPTNTEENLVRAFWYRTFGGNPFFPLKGWLLPPFFGEKKVPAKFTKRSPNKISQKGAPAKSYSTQNTD
jgi:hypothetical protein